MIRLERPGTSSNCYCCGCYCSTDEIEVQAPAGTLVGHVRQDPSGILRPWFSVVDSDEQVVFKIKGPFLGCRGLETEFEVYIHIANHSIILLLVLYYKDFV